MGVILAISAGASAATRISPMASSAKQDNTHEGLTGWWMLAAYTAPQIGTNAKAVTNIPIASFCSVVGSLFRRRRIKNTDAKAGDVSSTIALGPAPNHATGMMY